MQGDWGEKGGGRVIEGVVRGEGTRWLEGRYIAKRSKED